MLVAILKDAKKRKFAQMVAERARLEYASFRNIERMVQALSEDPNAIIFADPPPRGEYLDFEAGFADVLSPGRVFYLCEKRIEHFDYLSQSALFGGHVSSNNNRFWNTENSEVAGCVIRQVIGKPESGLESFLNRDAKIVEIPLVSTQEKNTVVAEVRKYTEEFGLSDKLSEAIAVAADELLMNAMYDAPVDELGNPLFTTVARNTAQSLTGPNRIRFLLGFDSEHCAVQAVDYFGSMDRQKVLSHVAKVYWADEYQVSQRTAGAGLGLATIYRTEASLFFRCQSRKLTEATAVFSLKGGVGKMRNTFQFVATRFE